jgi:signal transduction histidine kinase
LEARLDELSHKNWELQQNNAMKSEYLSTMSHELRTPLNSVIGFSEALLGVKSLDERQLRWVANIHDSGQHLLSLINDVLDLAKLESGKMKVKREYVNVALLCTQVVSLFKPQAENKSLELLLNVPDNLPDLRTDQGKLRQILSNLLSNALKFTPDGGRITLKSWQANGVAYFSVADTGIGIAAEHQSVIFQKFRQSTASLTREAGGTGLGLSIVRELCKLLGGDIAVQSEPGRGSTFTVNILAQMSEELIDPLLLDADAFQSSSK